MFIFCMYHNFTKATSEFQTGLPSYHSGNINYILNLVCTVRYTLNLYFTPSYNGDMNLGSGELVK